MIKGIVADLIVVFYLLGTLFLRFTAEQGLEGHPFISVGVGAVMLLFLWALIKANVLKPDYFGLLKKKSSNPNQ